MKKVSTAFIFSDKKILLFHRDDKPTIVDPDCWDVIGGHADPDETPEETLIREVREEISVEVKHPKHIATFKDYWDTETDLYLIELTPNQAAEAKIGEGEGQEIKFFNWEDLRDLKLTQNMKKYLINYENILKQYLI